MTDDPTCEVCGSSMVAETRTLDTWTVKTSSIRGGPVQEKRSGWHVSEAFECGARRAKAAGSDTWDIAPRDQCPHAHGMVLKLKRRIAELEAEKIEEEYNCADRAAQCEC